MFGFSLQTHVTPFTDDTIHQDTPENVDVGSLVLHEQDKLEAAREALREHSTKLAAGRVVPTGRVRDSARSNIPNASVWWRELSDSFGSGSGNGLVGSRMLTGPKDDEKSGKTQSWLGQR